MFSAHLLKRRQLEGNRMRAGLRLPSCDGVTLTVRLTFGVLDRCAVRLAVGLGISEGRAPLAGLPDAVRAIRRFSVRGLVGLGDAVGMTDGRCTRLRASVLDALGFAGAERFRG